MQRLVALQVAGEIRPEHLSPRILAYRPPDTAQPPAGGLKSLVEDLERRVIRAALLRHGWNKSRTAAELGLVPPGAEEEAGAVRTGCGATSEA